MDAGEMEPQLWVGGDEEEELPPVSGPLPMVKIEGVSLLNLHRRIRVTVNSL